MAVHAANRRSPRRFRRLRWLCCQGFLASPAVITALLLVLSAGTAASKGLPQSAGGAGPSPRALSQGDVGGSGATNSQERDRLPSSARPVPTRQSDGDWKTRRKPATPTPTPPPIREASPNAGVAGARAAAAAAERRRRRRPRPQQQQPAATKAKGAGAPDEDNEDEDSSAGLDFDSDSDSDSGELGSFSWSDGGRSGDENDGWSDDDGDEEESDWGGGAAGGPGGSGGRGKARRRQAAKGGGGGGGAGGAGRRTMGMSSIRSRLNVARQRASSAYREAKSLMSSEMEGVVLKATRPDDMPVKPKHLEALMRPTAEMPKEFNVYLPVVRKLWSKMADKEWRVAAKALYIVHRFAADGSIEHASNLKESVAVLRTHHDSRRKVNYFDMDTICDVKAPSWSGEDVAPMAEFLRGYADFVLRRTTQFGPAFAELLDSFALLAGGGEVITSVEGLVSAGSKCCVLREDQEGAVTAAAALQVAQDIRDVVEVCAAQLDYLAREWHARSAYPGEVDRWYAFLYENVEPVEALIGRANELAEKHKLPALRPLAAAPLVLKLRDEEVALEKQAALRAEQQQCSVDEGEEKKLGPLSHGEQAGAAGLKASSRTEAAVRDGGGGGGSSEGENQAMVDRRQQGMGGREESALSSSPADTLGDPALNVAAKKKVKSARGRKTTGAKSSSSSSAAGAGAADTRGTTSGDIGIARQPAVQRPGGGTGTGAATAAAEPRQEGGAKTMSSQGASGTRAADRTDEKSRARKKKRSTSSVSSKALGREERLPRPSSGTGGVKRGASAGATAAGASGSSSSSSSREQKPRVQGDSSVPKKERKRKLSPPSEKPPRSG